jgi:putative ABC transport system permease protein
MILSHLKIAWKVLLRRKFFTFVSLFGTAFTLVVLMVIAAMMDGFLSPGGPEVNLDRTLFISRMAMRGEQNEWTGNPGYGFLDKYCRDLPGVAAMSIYTEAGSVTSFLDGEKILSDLRRTDGDYWSVFAFRFLEGRAYSREDVANAASVAVITAATRRRFFGEGPALGRTLETGGRSYTVIGVVADVPRVRDAAYGEIWAPLTTIKGDEYRTRLMGNFTAALLARSKGDFPAIRAEFARRLPTVQLTDPENYDRMEGSPRTRFEELAGEAAGTEGADERPRTALFVAVGMLAALLFMSLPAINLVNLNISRILERSSEIGIRKAFGATSGNLVGQFLLENLVLVLMGGAIGFMASAWILDLINRSGWIPHAAFQLNWRVFLAAFALSAFFGLLSGVYPAWRMSRLEPVQALNGGSR